MGVIRIRDILNNLTNTYTTETVDEKYVVENGDILVGMDGDFHMCRWAAGKAYLNQRVCRFRPKGALPRYVLFRMLEGPVHYFNQTITGTTVAHLGDNHLKTIDVVMPDTKIIAKSHEVFDPLFALEITLRQKNANLRRTRDLLLPKLVSGEIDVGGIELSEN